MAKSLICRALACHIIYYILLPCDPTATNSTLQTTFRCERASDKGALSQPAADLDHVYIWVAWVVCLDQLMCVDSLRHNRYT